MSKLKTFALGSLAVAAGAAAGVAVMVIRAGEAIREEAGAAKPEKRVAAPKRTRVASAGGKTKAKAKAKRAATKRSHTTTA